MKFSGGFSAPERRPNGIKNKDFGEGRHNEE
jgi:hypothetical protein